MSKKIAKTEYVRARVTPKKKAAVTKKAESLELAESEVVVKLLDKWLKNEIEI